MPGIWLFACLTDYYRLKQRKTMDSMIGQQEISRTSCQFGTKSSVYGRTLARARVYLLNVRARVLNK